MFTKAAKQTRMLGAQSLRRTYLEIIVLSGYTVRLDRFMLLSLSCYRSMTNGAHFNARMYE